MEWYPIMVEDRIERVGRDLCLVKPSGIRTRLMMIDRSQRKDVRTLRSRSIVWVLIGRIDDTLLLEVGGRGMDGSGRLPDCFTCTVGIGMTVCSA